MLKYLSAYHAYYRVKNLTRISEIEENRGNRRITVSLGADVSEGYVLRYELHPAEHFTFTAMALGLETPQQLGERLAAQVIATLDEKKQQPDRIACDLSFALRGRAGERRSRGAGYCDPPHRTAENAQHSRSSRHT